MNDQDERAVRALKELVDTFSILADKKDVQGQLPLFTEDAVVKTYVGDRLAAELKGRQQIGESFSQFLSQFHTVYHLNGQQVVDVQGDKATGTAYCLVTLIGDAGGKRITRTQGISYQDHYARVDGSWRIAHRVSNFVWVDTKEVTL